MRKIHRAKHRVRSPSATALIVGVALVPSVLASADALAGGAFVRTESVSSYQPCVGSGCTYPPCYSFSGDLPNANSNAAAFWNTLATPNTLNFSELLPYTDISVWDSDFLDPDLGNAADDDADNFDEAQMAISFYDGHGNSLAAGTSQSCTSASTCTSPQSGYSVGVNGHGSCVYSPGTGTGHGVCFYSQTPRITLCGNNDKHGHGADLVSHMALGENTTVGAWRGAGNNGGTSMAIVHMSWGLVPFFPQTEWRPLFAGLQIYAGLMVPSGDTADSAGFGHSVAAGYANNPSAAVAGDYVNAMSFITDGSGCSGGVSYHGGINGCGCHVATTFSSSSSNALAVIGNTWGSLKTNDSRQTSSGWYYWVANCNYSPSTYPWLGE